MIENRYAAAILVIMAVVTGSGACRNTPYMHYDLQVIKLEKGWGYKIRKNNKPFIYQKYIAAIAGKTAFPDKKSAKKTGKRVLAKLRNNQMPYISISELIQLGVIRE